MVRRRTRRSRWWGKGDARRRHQGGGRGRRRGAHPVIDPVFPPPPPPLPLQATNTVYVGNVESTVDEFTIKSIFENCGTVTNVRLAG